MLHMVQKLYSNISNLENISAASIKLPISVKAHSNFNSPRNYPVSSFSDLSHIALTSIRVMISTTTIAFESTILKLIAT